MRNIELLSNPDRDAIGVNRELDLSRIAAIGLDLDHTLAVYDAQGVNELALAETCRNLIRKKAYPAEIDGIRYSNSAVARGLVLDLEWGGVLKCDFRDRVLRAFDDGEWLSREATRARYSDDPLELTSTRFVTIDSTFDLPASCIFGTLGRSWLETGAIPADYGVIYEDIREMLDKTHTTGRLKRRVTANIGRMVAPMPLLGDLLTSHRAASKKFFLLTNSGYEYTARLMDHIFSHPGTPVRWGTLFDMVVVHADKPDFFEKGGQPTTLEVSEDGASIVSGGVGTHVESCLGVSGDQILYLGDNPTADADAARRLGWRTGLIVPELDRGQPAPDSSGTELPPEGWGSALWDDGMPTRFARVICEHADVFSGRVENLLSVSPDHAFKTG